MNAVLQILYVARWGFSVIFIGFIVGVMCVLFPPLAVAGVVALAAVFLLWALPELRAVPEKLLRKFFFVMMVVIFCVPNYYAIETGVIPWITARRLFILPVIIFLGLTVAGSKAAREKITSTLASNRLLAIAAIGFLIPLFLSIFTSVNWTVSFKIFSEVILEWYVPFFAAILVIRNHEDVVVLLKVIAVATIFISFAGLIEFITQHKYYFDIMPKSMLDSMLKNNPALAIMFNWSVYRDGSYRANSIFGVSLSFGEFVAMVSPIAAYFILEGRDRRERALGVIVGVSCLIGLYCSGSRGSYVAFLIAMPVMAFIWTVRHSKLHPESLVSGIMRFVFTAGTIATFLLVLFWPRLHSMVLGYDDGDRILQWNMALPHIIDNPVTGHGLGNSGWIVGYAVDWGGVPSVDSYIITLLVELGVPGFLLFVCMLAIAGWTSIRSYLTDMDPQAAVSGHLACSLLAFTVYRISLSQQENHVLLFVIIGVTLVLGKLANDRRTAMRRSGLPDAAQFPSGGMVPAPEIAPTYAITARGAVI